MGRVAKMPLMALVSCISIVVAYEYFNCPKWCCIYNVKMYFSWCMPCLQATLSIIYSIVQLIVDIKMAELNEAVEL
jgi:hypothetical protein